MLNHSHSRPRERGFSLVEVLAALVILGIVITTTLAVFVERTRRIQQATETILAYQALSNEAEVRRRIDFSALEGSEKTFVSDTAILAPLSPYKTAVEVKPGAGKSLKVSMTITWRDGKRAARLSLLRADTGGGNLW